MASSRSIRSSLRQDAIVGFQALLRDWMMRVEESGATEHTGRD
jgi:hypothetical protein